MELTYLNLILSCAVGVSSLAGVIGVAVFSNRAKKEKIATAAILFLFFAVSVFGGAARFYGAKEGNAALAFTLESVKAAASVYLAFGLVFGGAAICLPKDKKLFPWHAAGGVACIAATVMLIINRFTRFLFDYESGRPIYNAAYFWILAIFAAILAEGFALLFINRKAISKYDKIKFSALFCLFACAAALDAIFPKYPIYALIGVLSALITEGLERIKSEDRYQKAKREADELRRDVSLAQAQIIQSQVSPHFIYNALTAIQALPNNPYMTKKAIGDFAKYLRQTLSSGNENKLIPFEKELENVQAYFRLEKIRFGDELNIVYDVGVTDFSVPVMSVQILAENAVKHGVSVKRGGGTVKISAKRTGDAVAVTVEDDGVGFDPAKALDSSHVGINNVKSRIKSLTGGDVEIDSKIGYGTKATITIPIRAGEE